MYTFKHLLQYDELLLVAYREEYQRKKLATLLHIGETAGRIERYCVEDGNGTLGTSRVETAVRRCVENLHARNQRTLDAYAAAVQAAAGPLLQEYDARNLSGSAFATELAARVEVEFQKVRHG